MDVCHQGELSQIIIVAKSKRSNLLIRSSDFSDELGGQCGRRCSTTKAQFKALAKEPQPNHPQATVYWMDIVQPLAWPQDSPEMSVFGPKQRAGRVNDRPMGKSRDSTGRISCLRRSFGNMSNGHPPLYHDHHDCPECSLSLVLYVGGRLIPGEGGWSHPCRKAGARVVYPCLAAELW
jgi:hypothetical protein